MTAISYPLAIGSGTTRIIECGAGPAVLLVHGLGARADRWIGTVERLAAQGYRAVAVDLPGHGYASKEVEAPSTVPKIANWLLAIMDALAIDRAALIGTSLGGHIVAYAGALAPERVTGLVLVGALGVVPIDQAVAETIRTNVQVRERERYVGKLNFVLHDPALVTEALVTEEWRMNTAPGTIEAFARLGAYLVDGIAADYVADAIKTRFSPDRALLVWGAEDKAVPVGVGEACRDATGVPLVTVADAAHCPYYEQPAAFDEIVVPFLASLKP